jgi:hypothetical protein
MMKKKSILIIGIVFLLFLTISLSGCIFRYGENIYEYSTFEYNANENTILDVSNINGQININGWDTDTVSFQFTKVTNERYGEEEFEKIEININEAGNKIVVETVYLENTNHVSVSMKIQVPTYINIGSIKTHNGGIYLSDLKGDIEAETKNGPIDIDNVDGYVEAITSNGPISVKDTTGVNDIVTNNGVIYAEVNDFKKDISIKTDNGNIDVYINPELNLYLDIESISTGGISLNEMLPLLVIERLDSHHIEAILGLGGNKINIRIVNGFINLHKLV